MADRTTPGNPFPQNQHGNQFNQFSTAVARSNQYPTAVAQSGTSGPWPVYPAPFSPGPQSPVLHQWSGTDVTSIPVPYYPFSANQQASQMGNPTVGPPFSNPSAMQQANGQRHFQQGYGQAQQKAHQLAHQLAMQQASQEVFRQIYQQAYQRALHDANRLVAAQAGQQAGQQSIRQPNQAVQQDLLQEGMRQESQHVHYPPAAAPALPAGFTSLPPVPTLPVLHAWPAPRIDFPGTSAPGTAATLPPGRGRTVDRETYQPVGHHGYGTRARTRQGNYANPIPIDTLAIEDVSWMDTTLPEPALPMQPAQEEFGAAGQSANPIRLETIGAHGNDNDPGAAPSDGAGLVPPRHLSAARKSDGEPWIISDTCGTIGDLLASKTPIRQILDVDALVSLSFASKAMYRRGKEFSFSEQCKFPHRSQYARNSRFWVKNIFSAISHLRAEEIYASQMELKDRIFSLKKKWIAGEKVRDSSLDQLSKEMDQFPHMLFRFAYRPDPGTPVDDCPVSPATVGHEQFWHDLWPALDHDADLANPAVDPGIVKNAQDWQFQVDIMRCITGAGRWRTLRIWLIDLAPGIFAEFARNVLSVIELAQHTVSALNTRQPGKPFSRSIDPPYYPQQRIKIEFENCTFERSDIDAFAFYCAGNHAFKTLMLRECQVDTEMQNALVAVLARSQLVPKFEFRKDSVEKIEAWRRSIKLSQLNQCMRFVRSTRNSLASMSKGFYLSTPLNAHFRDTDALEKLAIHCPRLSFRTLDNLLSWMAFNAGIIELDLSGCRLEDQGAAKVAQALKPNTYLHTLRLADCRFKTSGAKRIADFLNCDVPLKTLDISENEIEIDGLKAILSVLKRNRTLQTLIAGRTGVLPPAVVDELCALLQSASALHHLDMRGCALTRESKDRLAQALCSLPWRFSLILNELTADESNGDGAARFQKAGNEALLHVAKRNLQITIKLV